MCITSAVLSSAISDHMPICMFVRTRIASTLHRGTNETFQKVTDDTLTSFQTELKQTHWDDVLQERDAEPAYNLSLGRFVAVYKKKKHFVYKIHRRKKCLRK